MKRFSALLLITVLTGCASNSPEQAITEPSQLTTIVVPAITDITYVPLTIGNQTVAIERSINARSEAIQLDNKLTPVAGWQLPDYGVYQFKVETLITRKGFGTRAEAFMPELWLLDSQHQPIETLEASRLKYDEESKLSRENLTAEFILDNRQEAIRKPAYLLALTTTEARQFTAKVANFDEEYARIRARTAPPSPDVYATSASEGTLRLQITPLASHSKPQTVITPPPKPDYVPTPSKVTSKPKTLNDADHINQTYLHTIQSALAAKDINRAMALRASVRETHQQLQALFASSYGHQKAPLKSLPESSSELSVEVFLSNFYKHKLVYALKQDNPQSALAWIDQVERLTQEVDQLF